MTAHKIRLYIFAFISLCLMLLIFAFSAQDSTASQNLSDGVLYRLLSVFGAEQLMSRYEIVIRKLAHFSIYFALGASLYMTFMELVYVRSLKYPGVCAFVCSTLYAAGDELHQYFVPGRSMQLSDVLLDSAGTLTAIAAIYLIRKFVFMLREERKEHE